MDGRGVLHPEVLAARRAEEIEEIRVERQRVYDNMLLVSESITPLSVGGYDDVVINMVQADLNRHWAQFQTENARLVDALEEADEKRVARQEAIAVAREFTEVRALLDNRFQALQSQRNRIAPKASEIILQKFDGRYTGWTAWRSQFASKVKDTNLPADVKIDLLVQSLTKDVAKCIGDPERRDQVEFDTMWTKLESTYDNRYQTVTHHVDKLLDLPLVKGDAAKVMRQIIDTVEHELRSLDRFGYGTESWDPFVAVLMLRRLDPSTLEIWEMDRDPRVPPSKDDVIRFMERRILALRNVRASQRQTAAFRLQINDVQEDSRHNRTKDGRNGSRRRSPSVQQASTSHGRERGDQSSQWDRKRSRRDMENETPLKQERKSPPMCPECKKPHFMWFCDPFKSWPLERRLKQVEGWELCPCCLQGKHRASECTERGCPRCDNAKHNNMLCPKARVFRSNMVSRQPRAGQSGRQGPQ